MTQTDYSYDDRAAQAVEYLMQTLGKGSLIESLTDGRVITDPLPNGEHRKLLIWADNEDITREDILEAVTDEQMVGELETEILHTAHSHITNRVETSGSRRAQVVSDILWDYPETVHEDLIQSEIDTIEGQMGMHAHDYDDLLVLYQLLSTVVGKHETKSDRKKIWLELRKFVRYNVTVNYIDEDGDHVSYSASEYWQRESEAHNDVLRRAKHTQPFDELKGIHTEVEEFYSPSCDPLPDLDMWLTYI